MSQHDQADPAREIDAAGAARAASDGSALLIDVREPDEWAAGHAPDAVHMPLGRLTIADLPSDRPIVAVCRSGHRSGKATNRLRAAGLDVRNLVGGMQAWSAAGQPVVTADGGPGTVA